MREGNKREGKEKEKSLKKHFRATHNQHIRTHMFSIANSAFPSLCQLGSCFSYYSIEYPHAAAAAAAAEAGMNACVWGKVIQSTNIIIIIVASLLYLVLSFSLSKYDMVTYYVSTQKTENDNFINDHWVTAKVKQSSLSRSPIFLLRLQGYETTTRWGILFVKPFPILLIH